MEKTRSDAWNRDFDGCFDAVKNLMTLSQVLMTLSKALMTLSQALMTLSKALMTLSQVLMTLTKALMKLVQGFSMYAHQEKIICWKMGQIIHMKQEAIQL